MAGWFNIIEWAKYSAAKVSFVYLVAGIAWILLSDWAVDYFFNESIQNLIWFQTVKSIAFVGISSIILFLLIHKHEQKHKSFHELKTLNDHLAFNNNHLEKETKILQLNKSLEDFQMAINRSSIVSRSNPAGQLTFINENFLKITGYSAEELLGQNHRVLNSGFHDKEFWGNMWKDISHGKIWRGEIKNRKKDGNYYWVDTFVMPFMDDKGHVIEYLSIRHDITERKIVEAILREYNERFEILSRATNDAIWDWDIVHDFEFWNHGLKTIFGYDEVEIAHPRKWCREKIHPDDFDRVDFTANECFKKKLSQWSGSYRYLCADGTYKYVLDRAYIIYHDDKPVRMIGAKQDITEITEYKNSLEKKVEERTHELNEALKKEKELVEMKSRFVSIASHEFRTPLASISVASGFLRKFKTKITYKEMDRKLESIDFQVERMSWLLKDVLTIGKAEGGKITVRKEPIALQKFLLQIIEEIRQSTKYSHAINLKWDCDLSQFNSDENLMRNILINLLTNAIKFSPNASSIDMKISCDDLNLRIEVTDYGVGIPREDLSRLFQSFQRGSNVGTIQGTGLGLSIVKKAVELLQGEVNVKSKLNEGTRFVVHLPIASENNLTPTVSKVLPHV